MSPTWFESGPTAALSGRHREGRHLCRFSDAGNDQARHTLGGRRRKSAEARNRGKWGHRRCRGLYGDLAAASGWARLVRAAAPIALPRRMGVGDGPNECSRRCRTGLAVSLRADLSTCGKRRLCWPSQPEWRASLGWWIGWWIGGEGIMRCRSRSLQRPRGGVSAGSPLRRSR
jgi:hypothetical protein